MAKKSMFPWGAIGAWAFYIGFLVALLVGIFTSGVMPGFVAMVVLLVLGLIVGLLNIKDREIMPFLVASIAFMIAAVVSGFTGVEWIQRILAHIAVFILPAVVIAALKGIWAVAKD